MVSSLLSQPHWVPLLGEEESRGELEVGLSWQEVMEEGRDLEEQSDERPAALLHLYIDCVKGLVEPECPAHIPRPGVRLVRPRHGETTSQPVIEESFVFVIKRPLTDEVRVEVVDLAGGNEKVIGTCYINVWRDLVLPGLTRPLSPWSRIVMKGCLSFT